MIDYQEVIKNIVTPMVDDPQSISVRQLESINENELIFCVYGKSEDIARLIGRQGSMATAIRQVVSIGSRLDKQKVAVKFESY